MGTPCKSATAVEPAASWQHHTRMTTPRGLRHARRAVGATFALNGFVLASWVPHIPGVKAAHAIGDGRLGLVLLAMAAGAVLALPFAGWLNIRYGSRAMTLAAAAGLCLALPLPVVGPSVAAVAASLFAFGACNAMLDVSMNTQAVMVESRWTSPIMSSFHALFSLGGMVGAVVAGSAIGAGMVPWVHLVATAAGGFAVVAIAASRLLPDDGGGIAAPVFVRPSGPLLALGGLAFLGLMTEGAMGDWSAVWLRDSLHAQPGMAAAGFAAFSLAMCVGRFAGNALTAALGPRALLRWSGAVAAGGLGIGLVGAEPAIAVAGCALVGLGIANVIPVLFSAAGRLGGDRAGPALAAVASTGYAGLLAGPPLIGLAADLVTLPVALGLVCVACATLAAGAGRVGE